MGLCGAAFGDGAAWPRRGSADFPNVGRKLAVCAGQGGGRRPTRGREGRQAQVDESNSRPERPRAGRVAFEPAACGSRAGVRWGTLRRLDGLTELGEQALEALRANEEGFELHGAASRQSGGPALAAPVSTGVDSGCSSAGPTSRQPPPKNPPAAVRDRGLWSSRSSAPGRGLRRGPCEASGSARAREGTALRECAGAAAGSEIVSRYRSSSRYAQLPQLGDPPGAPPTGASARIARDSPSNPKARPSRLHTWRGDRPRTL